VQPHNFPKIDKFVITKNGLKRHAESEHNCIMGYATAGDKMDFVDLLRYYAFTFSSLAKLREWKKYLLRYSKEDFYQAVEEPGLLDDGYIMPNPKYDPKYLKTHDNWHKTVYNYYRKLLNEWNVKPKDFD